MICMLDLASTYWPLPVSYEWELHNFGMWLFAAFQQKKDVSETLQMCRLK